MTVRGGYLAGILVAAAALLALSGGATAQDGGTGRHGVNVANAALTASTGKAASAAANSSAVAKSPTAAAAAKPQDDESLTIEGEKRFHANCGRCHQAPHKFPPRMMATIVRHMRVRATITDDDMRLILRYMTQ